METPFHQGKLLLLDKPFGWTSFDLVNKVRRDIERHYGLKRLGIKVGHAGTLDPLASGLMLVCTGKSTKMINELQGMDKEYTGTFYLGATSASFDQETPVNQTYPVAHIHEAAIRQTALKFIGEQKQIPPAFSAKQIDGKRAYEYAREGENVPLKSCRITIYEFEIVKIELPFVDFRVVCSKGTYIRSLARDFGNALDSGGMLSGLKRTRIGTYLLNQAKAEVEGIQFLSAIPNNKSNQIKFHPVTEKLD